MRNLHPIQFIFLLIISILLLPVLIFVVLCFFIYAWLTKRKLEQSLKKHMNQQNTEEKHHHKGRVIDHDQDV
ncbi:hypothetical protein [Facilibium subflavum]|uniref:hypothetical protein n=1 Tax=Facilibium subflavum TaxID=2219058 RepID=UPI000E64F0C4|nr:hypothetical protein [Facilibium subflavum]